MVLDVLQCSHVRLILRGCPGFQPTKKVDDQGVVGHREGRFHPLPEDGRVDAHLFRVLEPGERGAKLVEASAG